MQQGLAAAPTLAVELLLQLVQSDARQVDPELSLAIAEVDHVASDSMEETVFHVSSVDVIYLNALVSMVSVVVVVEIVSTIVPDFVAVYHIVA